MKENMLQQAAEFRNKNKKKQRRYRIVTLLAAIVVFCTTYALILPAITMEQNLTCEIEEHVHDSSCYLQAEEVMGKYMICGHTEVQLDPETVVAIFPEAESSAEAEESTSDETDQQTETEETAQSDELIADTEEISDTTGSPETTEYPETTGSPATEERSDITELQETSFETDETSETSDTTESEDTVESPETEEQADTTELQETTVEETDTEVPAEESEAHVHTAECFSEQPLRICTKAEHTHTELCYETSSMLMSAYIEVVLTPPEEEELLTDVTKGGAGAAEDENGNILYDEKGRAVVQEDEFNRITWLATVKGSKDSNLIGNTITDSIINGSPHYYSEADMAEGITVGFDDADGTWHYFILYPDSEGMTWTSKGWTYTIPESIVCEGYWCQETVALSNEYTYYFTYFSTTSDGLETGSVTYRNVIEIDGDDGDGWLQQTRGDEYVGIVKNGEFNTASGTYDWTITANIPAAKDGEPYRGGWFIWDTSNLISSSWTNMGSIDGTPYPQFDENGNLTGNLKDIKITITYNGVTYEIPYIDFADENDRFCYEIYGETDENGVYYSTGLYIGMRCICDEEHCLRWRDDADKCVDWAFYDTSLPLEVQQYCGCWSLEYDADLTVTYSRSSADLINEYGGLGYHYINYVSLNSYVPDENNTGELVSQSEGSDNDRVKIPGVLNKALSAEPTQYNDYTASYKITLNDDLMDFSEYRELTVVDTMSETLVYVIGTMEITAEDASGNITTLSLENGDYTVSYDADAHKITVVLNDPGQYRYVMSYDAQIVVESGVLKVDYSNSVYIDLFGSRYSEEDTEKVLSDIIYFSKNYQVSINKTKNGTDSPLAGAEFGLYAESGELIESDTTDDDGAILFETHVEDGVILRDHTHYYIQEITAPEGYHLDATKYWFVFCNVSSDTCETCSECAKEHSNTVRIPYETIGAINITNYYAGYKLPNTGGSGTALYTVSGAVLVSAALMTAVYKYIRRRKEDKASF